MPVTEILTHSIKHPLADFNDQVCLFSKWNEIRRQNDAALGQLPTDQCFGTDYRASLQVVFGLIMNEQLVALDVTLLEGRTGRHVGRVLHTKYKGNGVKMFDQSGTFQLRISTTLARYRIKIIQLTDEEAARYTPKNP